MKDILQPIYSPCYGNVEKVLVNEKAYVYEWETLFLIKTKEQKEVEVSIGVSGHVHSIVVSPGQEVTPDTVLTSLRDDLKITGSD